MRVAVFSDLHIKGAATPLAQAFAGALKKLGPSGAEPIGELWLLGDIFDLMVGNWEFWRREQGAIFDALEALVATGCRVRWCEGNHDFHIAKLLERAGIEAFDGEKRLGIGGRRVFLAHGDLVNEGDLPYLKWRSTTRAGWFRGLLDAVPGFAAHRALKPMAEGLSRRSRGRERDDADFVRDLYRAYARQRFEEGCDAVFLGHCHVEDLYVEDNRFYCNLGSALDGTLRYAVWNPAPGSFPKVEIY